MKPTVPVVGCAVVAGVRQGVKQLLNGVASESERRAAAGGLSARMGGRLDQGELRRRAIEGIREEVVAFGERRRRLALIRRDGLLAAVVPGDAASARSSTRSSTPTRRCSPPSSTASATHTRPPACGPGRSGCPTPTARPPSCSTPRARPRRGAAGDGAGARRPRPGPPRPDGIEQRPGDAATAAELNDRAYGYGPDGFRAGLIEDTTIRWHAALDGRGAGRLRRLDRRSETTA